MNGSVKEYYNLSKVYNLKQNKGKRIALQDHLLIPVVKIEKSIHVNKWSVI